MKGKKLMSLLMFPLLSGMLASCGEDNSKGIKIKFWHTFGQTVVDGLKMKIRDFTAAVKEHEGVDIKVELTYQGSYDDVATKIKDGYSVNNKPTIAVAYPDNVADYLEIGKSAGDNFVVNLDKFIDDDAVGFGKEEWLGDEYDETDFVEDFYDEGSKYAVAGTYSLPYMKSTEIMFYNMNMMKTIMAGVHHSPAQASDWDGYDMTIGNSETKIKEFMKFLTWENFMDLCQFIKNNMSKIGNALEVPAWYDSDANMFVTKMFQNEIGYSSIGSDGKGVIDFASGENNTKAINLLKELNNNYKAGLFTTKGIKNTYGSDFFTSEKCVFSIGSSGGSGYNFPQADAFQLGVCRVPHSNGKALYVTQGPTLALFSDNGLSAEKNETTQLYAWRFLKYITNGQANAELCVNGSEGYVPVRQSAYETAFFQEFLEEGEDYAKCYKVILGDINGYANYLVSPAFKGSAALRDECGSLLTAAIQVADQSTIASLVQTCVDNAMLKF